MDPRVFVSEMIARGEHPILVGFRHEPVESRDSGWQFTAGDRDDMRDMRLWAMSDLIAYEPSVVPYLSLDWELVTARRSWM